MSESIEQYRARRAAEARQVTAEQNARKAADARQAVLQKSNTEAIRKAAADARAAFRG